MCFQTWVLGIAHHDNLKTGLEKVEKYKSQFYALLLTTYFVLFCVTSQLPFKNWKIVSKGKILNSISVPYYYKEILMQWYQDVPQKLSYQNQK